ncbi:MAG: hemin uptake protein HemP [Methylococcales symbiont of Hymedesmia sp. n. MRB-2018]|nr:MAG: hemin uptake protein HemP [Methylococcales symbiont of Hymedesmia sp. n. MRB-2018]KAF3984591.1 MAG: hemin uptake protein HemP [Methylococcales symbiont of Hymedesmia sp. n. MRB-2018]
MAEKTISNAIAYRLSTKSTRQITYQSGALFQGEKSIIIEHQSEHYFLRITKSEKLILTK